MSKQNAETGFTKSVMHWVSTHKQQVTASCVAAASLAYLAHKAYHSQSAASISKVKKTLQDYASVASSLSSTAALVASDLQSFLSSEQDELPQSIRQLTKLIQHADVQASITNTTTSISRAICQVATTAASNAGGQAGANSGQLLETVLDALLSDRGRSLVGMAVGLATKNATETFCQFLERYMQAQQNNQQQGMFGEDGEVMAGSPPGSPGMATVLNVLSTEQGERLVSLLITKSIKTAVSTYVDATCGINYYDDMLSSISKQEHRDAVSEIMSRVTASFCKELAAAYRRASRGSAGGSSSSSGASRRSSQDELQPASDQRAATITPSASMNGSVISAIEHEAMAAGVSCAADGVSTAAISVDAPGTPDYQLGAALLARPSRCNTTTTLVGKSVQRSIRGRLGLENDSQYSLRQRPGGSTISSSVAWMQPLLHLAREQDVRSLALDVVKSATREATKSTWETLFSGRLAPVAGASSSRDAGNPALQAAAMYRVYAALTVAVSLFMYAVSPRVIGTTM